MFALHCRPAAQQHRSSIDSTHLQAALRQPAAPAAAAQPPAASGVAAPHTYLAQMRAQLQQAAPPAARPAAQPQQHEAMHNAGDRNPGGGVGASGLAAARRQSDAAGGELPAESLHAMLSKLRCLQHSWSRVALKNQCSSGGPTETMLSCHKQLLDAVCCLDKHAWPAV